jgi:hypothetical protein
MEAWRNLSLQLPRENKIRVGYIFIAFHSWIVSVFTGVNEPVNLKTDCT